MPTTMEQAHGKPKTVEEVAAEYVMTAKLWQAKEFRIERRGLTKDQQYLVVWVIHADDEKNLHLGGGKSLALYLDRADHHVVRELHFQ